MLRDDGVGDRVAVASLDASLLKEGRLRELMLMVEDQKETLVIDEGWSVAAL